MDRERDMKLCKTCVYGTEYELDKPCIVYRADCMYYRKRGESMTIDKTETFIEHDIVVDGTKVGAVELCPERNEISRLEIFEPYQDKGYGTKVVKTLVERGYTSLWVRSDNQRAIHVYESCGFKRGKVCMFEMTTEALEQEPCEDIAQERYKDLCEYFGNAKDILKSREDFKAWLGRVKWYIRKAEELYEKYEYKQEPCDDAISDRGGQ